MVEKTRDGANRPTKAFERSPNKYTDGSVSETGDIQLTPTKQEGAKIYERYSFKYRTLSKRP